MITREQILKGAIEGKIIQGINRYDIVCYCYSILSVYYEALEECLYDFCCDIVDTMIAIDDTDRITIDLNNRKVVINND